MRLRTIFISIGVILLAGLLAISIRAYVVYKGAMRMEESAALMEVQTCAMRELHAFYLKNKRYPRTLKELPTQSIKFTEPGASLAMLYRLNYRSDGPRYMITRPGEQGTHKVSVVGTNLPVWEYVFAKNP